MHVQNVGSIVFYLCDWSNSPNIGFKKDLSARLASHYNGDEDEDCSDVSDTSNDSEDGDPLIGRKFSKRFINLLMMMECQYHTRGR